MRNNLLFSVVALSFLLPPVAIADTSSAERDKDRNHKESRHEPKMKHSQALEQMIQKHTEQQHAADAQKYAQLAAQAGNKKNELEAKRAEVINAYKTWNDLKSGAEMSSGSGANHFKAVEKAAEAYSHANKEFINLQKNILATNGVPAAEANNRIVVNVIPSDSLDVINAAPATAAGSK